MNKYKRIKRKGVFFYEHDVVWEKCNGKIPPGMIVHHKDQNKRNNNIDNLVLMEIRDHNRLHAGFIKENNLWFKRCPKCGQLKEVNADNWYIRKEDESVCTGYCKLCFREKMRNQKKQKAMGFVAADAHKI